MGQNKHEYMFTVRRRHGRACAQARTHAHVRTYSHGRLTQAPAKKTGYFRTHTHTESLVRPLIHSCPCTRARTYTFVQKAKRTRTRAGPTAAHARSRRVFMFLCLP